MSLNYNNIFLITIYLTVIATAIYGQIPKADSNLKFAVVIFRHGDRASFFKYKTDPHPDAFPEGANELTKFGKQHMYFKGQVLRRIYDGYLSKLYLDNEIYTKTTNVARTHMTAAMVLTGLYPPTNYQKWSNQETLWQPIPVYGGSPDHGDGNPGNCSSFDPTFLKAVTSTITGNGSIALKPLLSLFSEKCGQPIDIQNVFGLFDLFTCQLAAGLELPEWTKPDIYEQLKAIFYNEEYRRNFNGNTKLQNLIIGPLLKEITLKIQQKSSGDTGEKRKILMYSGHDFSILFMTAALGHLIETPKFGSSLHFHVYRLDNTDEDVIKVYYLKSWDDDKGEEISISNCDSPCKVSDFINIANNKFAKTWEEECNTQ